MNLHGPVRAIKGAGPGTALVKIEFDAWKGAAIEATTHAISVVLPKPGPKPAPVSSRFVKTLVHPNRKATVFTAHYSADATRLFIAGYPSGAVQVFHASTGKELRRIESPPGLRGSADYSVTTPELHVLYVPVDRRRVVTTLKDGAKQHHVEYNGEVLAWDLASGKSLPSLAPSAKGRGVMQAYLSPTGKQLVTVERASRINGVELADETLLWDLTTRKAQLLGKGYGMAAFSRDGRQLAVALFSSQGEPGRLLVRDLDSGRTLFSTRTAKGLDFSWPVFSADGATLAVNESANRINQPATIRLIETESGKELAAFDSGGKYPFMEMAFSPDGRRLAAADYHGDFTIWDVRGRKVERTVNLGGMQPGRRLAFSPDGRWLAVEAQAKWDRADIGNDPDPADLPQPRLFLFDLVRGGEPEVAVCPHGYCGALAFCPDNKTLAVGGSGRVHLFDMSRK